MADLGEGCDISGAHFSILRGGGLGDGFPARVKECDELNPAVLTKLIADFLKLVAVAVGKIILHGDGKSRCDLRGLAAHDVVDFPGSVPSPHPAGGAKGGHHEEQEGQNELSFETKMREFAHPPGRIAAGGG